MIGYVLLGLILVFLAVILYRAWMFKPYSAPSHVEEGPFNVNKEKTVADMVDMIRCKTVSRYDDLLPNREEFLKFQQLLEERFPLISKACTLEKIGHTGLLYHLKGRSSSNPSVCMAHYDVVPADESAWDKPPFEGLTEDGFIWGRGTLDTKGTLCGIMEALEQLLSEGFVPKQDLYLSFCGDEEVAGSSCEKIVEYLEQKGVKPAFVLDEGGAVVERVFPGVTKPCALIGVGEKVTVNVELSMNSTGGHASTPPPHTIIGHLSKAVVRIENNPFPAQLTKPVKEMLDVLGRHSTFLYKVLFANLWCFLPLLNFYCKLSGGELNAMMRTTCAATTMEGSKFFNVLPPKASIGMNLRLLGNDTVKTVEEHLNKVIGNDKIKVSIHSAMKPSGYSDTSCEEWELLRSTVQTTWPDAIVTPYLMLASSDSRHFARITDRVYKFSAMALSKEERGMIHGNNERIPIDTLIKTVEFYIRLIKGL